MSTVRCVFMLVIALGGVRLAALAQPASRTAAPRAQPVQIGVAIDELVLAAGDGAYGMAIGNLRVTTPLGGRLALEGFVSVPRHESDSYDGAYGVQIKQHIVRASCGRVEIFATYGVMGWYSHAPAEDYTYTYAGKPEVFHRPSRTDIIAPVIGLAGIGVERRVATAGAERRCVGARMRDLSGCGHAHVRGRLGGHRPRGQAIASFVLIGRFSSVRHFRRSPARA